MSVHPVQFGERSSSEGCNRGRKIGHRVRKGRLDAIVVGNPMYPHAVFKIDRVRPSGLGLGDDRDLMAKVCKRRCQSMHEHGNATARTRRIKSGYERDSDPLSEGFARQRCPWSYLMIVDELTSRIFERVDDTKGSPILNLKRKLIEPLTVNKAFGKKPPG